MLSPLLVAAVPALGAAPAPPCDLTGSWRWDRSEDLDIEISMTGASEFEVVLRPDKFWHNATAPLMEHDVRECLAGLLDGL
eukprot:gene11186-9750_t